MAKEQVWRMVDGNTIRCDECVCNKAQEDGSYICTAEDETCVFMKKKIDGQKTWNDFHDAYREVYNWMGGIEGK